MEDLGTAQIALIVAGLAGSAILAGILAGLLGVGGGIVLVPVLYWLLSLTDFPPELGMQMAVATSLATIIFTSISSTRAHHRRGTLDLDLLRLWAPGIVIGALSGGIAAGYMHSDGLKLVFGVIALLLSVNMASPRTLVIRPALPRNRLANRLTACVTGLISAMMGIGGGTLAVPLLSAFSVDIRRAVGTAAAFGFLIAVPAVAGFIVAGLGVPGRPPFSLGYVNLLAAAIILPFTVYFAPVGAALTQRLDRKWIKRAFALFLGITAVRMLSSLLG